MAIAATSASAPANSRAADAPPQQWVADRLVKLREERSKLGDSKPDLAGTSWARHLGTAGGGLAGVIGGSVGAVFISEHVNYFKKIFASGSIDAQVGAAGALIVGAGAIMLVSAFGANKLGSHLTRPQGADRDSRIATHEAQVAEKVAAIDRQIAALELVG